jgi:hypothetical protein
MIAVETRRGCGTGQLHEEAKQEMEFSDSAYEVTTDLAVMTRSTASNSTRGYARTIGQGYLADHSQF